MELPRRKLERRRLTADEALASGELFLENHLGGADAEKYRRYQYDLIAPYCGRSLLEVGAGFGEFSEHFSHLDHLILTDTDPHCLRALRERFGGRPNIEVRELDLRDEFRLQQPVETVVAMNVLEHIKDDVAALRALAGVVAPGGSLVMWVPAYPALYGDFDRKVGHERRYTPRTLRDAFEAAGLTPEVVRPVNLLGGIAWWLAVRIGGRGAPSGPLVRLYDRVVIPTTRLLERAFRPPFGQTVLGVARKPEQNRA